MRRTPIVPKSHSPKLKTIGLNGLSIQPYMIERSQMRPTIYIFNERTPQIQRSAKKNADGLYFGVLLIRIFFVSGSRCPRYLVKNRVKNLSKNYSSPPLPLSCREGLRRNQNLSTPQFGRQIPHSWCSCRRRSYAQTKNLLSRPRLRCHCYLSLRATPPCRSSWARGYSWWYHPLPWCRLSTCSRPPC